MRETDSRWTVVADCSIAELATLVSAVAQELAARDLILGAAIATALAESLRRQEGAR